MYSNNQTVVTKQPSVGLIDLNASVQTQTGNVSGLNYLAVIDQLLISQKVEVLESLTNYESENKYKVKNTLGQTVFYAGEESGCCSRCWCGNMRALNMDVYDHLNRKVLKFERPLKCQYCCFPCCLQKMEVKFPITGEVIGIIEQNWGLVRPSLRIKTPQGETVLKVRGPPITCRCCCDDVVFNILTAKGDDTVGTITKQWSGCCKESFTDADNFGVTFPFDLDVKVKATLLAACFLIDYMYYESGCPQLRDCVAGCASVTRGLMLCLG